MLKKCLAVIILTGFYATVHSSPAPAMPRLIRPLGMGGAFSAVADDENALFYNPAGLAKTRESWALSLPLVTVDTNQDTYDIAKWFIDNMDRLTGADFSTWTQSDIDKLSSVDVKLGINSGVSLMIAPFAIGLYGIGNVNMDMTTLALIPQATLDINLDFVLPVGFGKKIDFIPALNDFFDSSLGGGELYAGVTFKLIRRYSLTEVRSALEFEDLNPVSLMNKAQDPKTGLGFDFGLMFTIPSIDSTVALAIQDIYTTIGGETVKGSVDLGFAFKPEWALGPLGNFVVAFDINSINDGDLTFFNKLHIGVETTLLGLLALRGGLYQGCPSFGIGLSLGPFKFDYVSNGVELGRYPGQIEDRQHTIAVGLRF